MINLINRARDDVTLITIFNVDFNHEEENIRGLYQEITFRNIKMPKKGVFLLEFEREQALRFVEAGTKVIFDSKLS